jgi:diguanylate cyclase (GGDEF)-like protein
VLLPSIFIAIAVPLIIAAVVSHILMRLLFEVEAAQAALLQIATKDALTQVYNRRYFMDQLQVEIARSQRFFHPLCLLMIDVDSFKGVNDGHGHAAGDLVLQDIAKLCSAALAPDQVLARYGGEEFTILLPKTPIQVGCVVAERLRSMIESLHIEMADGRVLRVTVSVGVSSLTPNENDAAALLAKADSALYQAKRDGRNRWVRSVGVSEHL